MDVHKAIYDAMCAPLGEWNNAQLTSLKERVQSFNSNFTNARSRYNLNEDESGAILYYTCHSLNPSIRSPYMVLNQLLVSRDIESLHPWMSFIYYLISGLYKLPTIPPTTVYRAIKKPLTQLSPQYTPGSHVVWVAFTSTSSDTTCLKQFIDKKSNSGTIMEIKCTEGKDISQFSFYSGEKEILLSPNSTFLVKSVKKSGNMDEIVLEQQKTPNMSIVNWSKVLWVDSNHDKNERLHKKIENSSLHIQKFGTTTELQKWIDTKYNVNYLNAKNCCIISNGYRKDDGGELAGVKLYHWLQGSWSHIPFLLFCSDPTKISSIPSECVTNDEAVVCDFCNRLDHTTSNDNVFDNWINAESYNSSQ
eukprot:TRINITY_DN16600_c0_g1_i1.p1 TRINITY_DN16600_c0_g1~~TRINITY_DN16600_c0_g1_i1.p1  ORF type:complete len:362 (+),score=71.26 TRINITY_DN16600_c0_g1_i1:130-1215(+)